MNQSPKNIAQKVSALIEPVVRQNGCSLWDVEFVKEAADYYLRITIDKPEGIDINDCERVHRALDPILDEADPIPNSYHLEVSSPGIERILRTDAHYAACTGEKIGLKLFAAYEGKKAYTGILKGADAEAVTIEAAEGEISIPRELVSKAGTIYNFE